MRFLAEDLWTMIEGMQNHDGPRRIAVAYLSCDKRFRLQSGDVAIVNASDEAIRGGQTSADALYSAAKAGVQLFSDGRLHAKVIITSREVLVGSANISQNSPKLHEAAMVSTEEAVRSAAEDWWNHRLEESIEIDRVFLERIRKIPVERHGEGRNGKPTIAEALEGNLPVLKDFHFGWHHQSCDVSRRIVADKARSKGLLPPRIPTRSWTWYEWKYEPNLLERIRSDCQGKPGIEFEGVRNDDGVIDHFKSVDQMAWNFIGAFRVKGRSYDAIIMVALCQNAPGLRLTGAIQRRELAERLTRGLAKRLNLKKQLSNRKTGRIELGELRDLYQAGRT